MKWVKKLKMGINKLIASFKLESKTTFNSIHNFVTSNYINIKIKTKFKAKKGKGNGSLWWVNRTGDPLIN